MKVNFFYLLTFFLFLSGCSKEKVQTVEWYKQHESERKDVIKQCRDNPGELKNTPNCLNAEQAKIEIAASTRGHLKLEPVKF